MSADDGHQSTRPDWGFLAVIAVVAICILYFVSDLAVTIYERHSGGGPAAYTAGYQWAKKNGIRDWRTCPTEPKKFSEGCTAYLDDVEAQSDKD